MGREREEGSRKEFEESKSEMSLSLRACLRPEPAGTGLPEGHTQSQPSFSGSGGQRVEMHTGERRGRCQATAWAGHSLIGKMRVGFRPEDQKSIQEERDRRGPSSSQVLNSFS